MPQMYDPVTGAVVRTLHEGYSNGSVLALNPGATQLAAGVYEKQNRNPVIRVFDVKTGDPLFDLGMTK